MKVKVGVSNRHVHLSEKDANLLFGENYSFKVLKNLSQTGQFAYEEKVIIKTPKSVIENVRILGPLRPYTQVEISKTDSYLLGIVPPTRDSGDLAGSSAITIVGPKAEVSLPEGCIIASRHIHLSNKDVLNFGLEGSTEVDIHVDGIKAGTLEGIKLKIDDSYVLELHLDTDNANAMDLNQGDLVIIKKK